MSFFYRLRYNIILVEECWYMSKNVINLKYDELPTAVRNYIPKIHKVIMSVISEISNEDKYKSLKADKEFDYKASIKAIKDRKNNDVPVGVITKKNDNTFTAMIQVTGHLPNPNKTDSEKLFHELMVESFRRLAPMLKRNFNVDLNNDDFKEHGFDGFDIYTSNDLAQASWDYHGRTHEVIKESVEPTPSYNTDMTEAQAKNTLKALSQSLINDFSEESKKKQMSQYTANIYANVITKNLLPRWANGFSKVRITLDSYQSFNTFEFIPPNMGQDFVARFINGKESLNGFIHRSPEIRIKMSPRVFHSMKSPDDAYNFFKAAIQYYDSKLEKSGNKLMVEMMKLGHNMKHLIANSKLTGIVTLPLSLLFTFDDVDMSTKDTFKVNDEDIQSINKFVKNIASRYAAPEKEKKQIIEDVKKMVEALRESCEMTETIQDLYHLPEAVEKFLFEGYTDVIMASSRLFIEAQVDRTKAPQQLQYIRESWGVKKLKNIPKDLIPYIQIEAEAIKDSNDKMILSSYTLGKIEIVEWYIELLTVGSKKYVVPHTKPYLELVRTQLLACFKKIMNTVISKKDTVIGIGYPKGYEG